MGECSKSPSFVIESRVHDVGGGLTLINPLSRRAYGPGLILLSGASNSSEHQNGIQMEDYIPSPCIKWAEEGYTVVEITDASAHAETAVQRAVEELSRSEKCQPGDKIGIICYDPELWKTFAAAILARPEIVGAVIFQDACESDKLNPVSIPCLYHLAGKSKVKLERSESVKMYDYPVTQSYLFASPLRKDFHYSSEAISHSRSLSFLKQLMNGPYFDLEAIWDEHTYYEFGDRSVENTMATMVQEPYVNHVPTITGGIGRIRLTEFYQNHFIFNNPEDSELELISRTVGVDRIVDEFIFKVTHTSHIDWLFPGVPPTGKRAEIPFTAIVNIRGDRLYHEHISWDQGTALAQLGLLPEFLPFPYPVVDPKTSTGGKNFEYRLPITGIDTANKMRDRNSVKSNEMFSFAIREARQRY